MKIIAMILLAHSALLVVHAAPATSTERADKTPHITSYTNDNNGIGSYRFSYDTSDGSKREEEGNLVNPGESNEYIVVRGSYSYLGPDGEVYTVNYTADENGFHPEGVHIPQFPGEERERTKMINVSVLRDMLPADLIASLL